MPSNRPKPSVNQPDGKLVIQTLAMPSNTNPNGDIFGGWLVGQMDLGASIAAQMRSSSRTVTVAIDKLSFYHPLAIGDTVQVYARLDKVGRTSMIFHIQAWGLSLHQPLRLVSEGVFTFVAIDEQGRPREVPAEK